MQKRFIDPLRDCFGKWRRKLADCVCIWALAGLAWTAHANGTITPVGTAGSLACGHLAVSPDGHTIYGVTHTGGNYGFGTVFKMDTATGTVTPLHSFGNVANDGEYPVGGVVLAPDGWLYGTTFEGGANRLGAIFAVSINDDGHDDPYQGNATYHVIYSFVNGQVSVNLEPTQKVQDGQYPYAGLAIGPGPPPYGLFGTTTAGGNWGQGTAFYIQAQNGQAVANTYGILHTFGGTVPASGGGFSLDGANPYGDLALSGFFLYGTTEQGGLGYGTVFVVSQLGDENGQGSGNLGYRQIFAFHGPSSSTLTFNNQQCLYDGGYPLAGLVMSNSWVYGTTAGRAFSPNDMFLGPPSGPYINSDGSPGAGTVFGLQISTAATPPDIQLYNNTLDPIGWADALSDDVDVYPMGDLCWEFDGVADPDQSNAGGVLVGTICGGSQQSPSGGQVFEVKGDGTLLNPSLTLSGNPAPGIIGGLTPASVTVQRQWPLFGPYRPPLGNYETVDYALVGPALDGQIFKDTIVPGIVLEPFTLPSGQKLWFPAWADPPNVLLQSAPSVTGPWTNIVGAASPYTNVSMGAQQYFRLALFQTNQPPLPPHVAALPPLSVGPNSVTLLGQVIPNGSGGEAWLEFGTSTNYSNIDAASTFGASSVAYITNTITGLTIGQTYHYQLFATNSVGFSSGGDMTFTVLPGATTLSYSFIDPTDVVLYGSVSPDSFGWDCYPYFEYGTTTNYGETTSEDFVSATNTGSVIVTNIIGGLAPGTLYHYQFVGFFSIPEPFPDPPGYYLANGGDFTFTTPPGPPIPVVVPNAQTNTAGDNANLDPFSIGTVGESNMRYQQVYAASQFSAAPAGGAFITAIAFRLPPNWFSFSNTLSAVQIDLSTTTNAPDGLSSTFANNAGTNDIVVFDGPLSLSSADIGNPPAFDIVVPLTTPFFYNPSAGNLLLDVRNTGGGATTAFDAVSTGEFMSRVWGNVSSSTGNADPDGLVTEFVFATP